MHCGRNYDDLCYSKRKEMYDLVQKCEKLKAQSHTNEIKVCREVLSIYCYVYFTRDLLTCFGTEYDQYIPGKKTNGVEASTSTKSIPSSKRISINVITTSSNKPVVLTTSSWYKPVVITTASKLSTTTTTAKMIATSSSTKSSANNGLVNPFEGTSVITVGFYSKKQNA